jgi:class 3 adenylate cyclase
VETVTVLFTDLVGSTGMASRIGPASADEVRHEYFGILREAIADAGGNEVKNLGDGLMVAFVSASSSLDCAAGMQRRIARRNRSAEDQLSVRIGVSLGEATREEDDFFGPPVIEAARLCAAADGDQVLVSELLRTIVTGRSHEFEPVGELSLKGLPEPVTAFEFRWQSDDADEAMPGGIPLPARLRAALPAGLVGRADERAILGEIGSAVREGRRQVVLISGEPGIGKTRLATHAALEAHAKGAAVLFGSSTEGLEAPYSPWRQALSHYVEHGPPEVIEAHVARHGNVLSRPSPEIAEGDRYGLHAAVVDLLETAAREEPLVVVLDDLHWADPRTLDLLSHVVASTSTVGLLIVGTYRETELARGPRLTQLLGDLRRERDVHRIDLKGLGKDDVGALMEGAVGQRLPEEARRLADEIVRETDGNPFFVAEILRHLDESGAVAPDESGRWALTGSLAELGLPKSIREVVTGRAARLGAETADLLSRAAVIGREFDLALLSRIVDQSEDEILDRLDLAAEVALVNESSSAGRFSFAHSLVNHVLSEELGAARRQQTHRRIAAAVEDMYVKDRGEKGASLALPSISTPAFLADARGVILNFNEAAGEVLGVSFEQMGRMDPEVWLARFGPFGEDGEAIPIDRQPLAVALREGRAAHTRHTIHNADGEPREVEVSAMPIITADAYGAIVMFWPIDESGDPGSHSRSQSARNAAALG